MTKTQTLFRRAAPGKPYTEIDNQLLQSRAMPLDCIGFVASMLSREIHWDFNRDWAKKEFRIGDDKLDRILRDARKANFCKVVKEKSPSGRFTGTVIHYFTDVPGVFAIPENTESTVNRESPVSVDMGDTTVNRVSRKPEKPETGKPPHIERKERTVEKKETAETESAAADSGASARKEAEAAAPQVPVSVLETSTAVPSRALTPVQARKGTNTAIAKRLNGKRQPDMLEAASTAIAAPRIIDQQILQGFTCWFDAMGDLWAGTRVSSKQRTEMRKLIEIEGIDYVLALGAALVTMQFGRGQASGHIVELNRLLTDGDTRDKVFGLYQRPPLVRQASVSASTKPASAIDEAIAAGADERIVRKLGRTLLTIKAGADAKGREADWLLGLSETLADLGEIPEDMLTWAAKDMRNNCSWRPEISTILTGFQMRLRDLASWQEEEQFLAEMDAAWAEEQKARTYSGWPLVGKPLPKYTYAYREGEVYTEERLFEEWLTNTIRHGKYRQTRMAMLSDPVSYIARTRKQHELSFEKHHAETDRLYWPSPEQLREQQEKAKRAGIYAGVLL